MVGSRHFTDLSKDPARALVRIREKLDIRQNEKIFFYKILYALSL